MYVLSQVGAKPSHPAQTCASFGGRVQVLLICVTWDRSSLYSTLGPHMCSQIYFVGVTRVTYFMSFEGATVMSSWTILTFPRHLGCST